MGARGDYIHDPLQLGMTIVGVTVVFGGAGWWLDRQLGTFPFLMVIGAAGGLFGIIYVVVLRLRETDKTKQDGPQP